MNAFANFIPKEDRKYIRGHGDAREFVSKSEMEPRKKNYRRGMKEMIGVVTCDGPIKAATIAELAYQNIPQLI